MNKPEPPSTTVAVLPWQNIDTVMLDMDGTLLDKYFDDYFWEKYLPKSYARKHLLSEDEAEVQLLARYRSVESTLQWTDLDYWSEHLDLDIPRLKIEIHHLIDVHAHVVDFLQWVRSEHKALHLVTNAHPKTLEIKLNKTRIGHYFDEIICSAEVGAAKEQPSFWRGLESMLDFSKERTLFADDTEKVLAAARDYGIGHLVHIARPSSRIPLRYSDDYLSIADFSELLPG